MPQAAVKGFESKPLVEGFESKPLTKEKPQPSLTERATSTATDLVKGAVKGAGQTITTLGTYARKIPGVSALDKVMTPVEFSTTPTNTTQSIGKAGEQVAEFFLPSSLSGKATAYLVGALPKWRWAVALAKAIPEAASAYGVSLAQGDPNAKTSAAIAGAIPGAAGLVSKAGPALEAAAERGVGKAFQVGSDKRLAAMARRVAPDVLAGTHGSVWAMTMRAVEDRAERLSNGIGEKIEEQIKQYGHLNFGDTVDGMVKHLEDAKDAYRVVVPAEKMLEKTGEMSEHAILYDPRKVRALSRLQNTLQQLKDYDAGQLENLIGVRRAWDEVVASAGGFAERGRTGTRAAAAGLKDKTEAWAHREGTRAIRQVLSSPEHTDLGTLQKLNAQYSFWTTIQDLSEGALNKTEDKAGRIIKALGMATGGIVGGEVGQSKGGGLTGGIIGGLTGAGAAGLGGAALGRQIVEASRSPAFRLASAQVKHQIAEAIMSGNVDRASRILGRFTAATAAGSPKATP